MPLRVSTSDRIATVVFDRPRALNALSPSLLRELIDACEALGRDASVRVVRVEGEGDCFSAGADLAAFMGELTGDDPGGTADLGRAAADALAALPQITVAGIRGHCVGGGIVLAGACDMRIAGADARFLVPELDAGIPLAWGGTERLARLVGETVAADWVLTCRPFGPEEALRAGFVSQVVGPSEFGEAYEELVESIAKRPANVLAVTKQQLSAIRAGVFDGKKDADHLLDALKDPESLEKGAAYMASKFRR